MILVHTGPVHTTVEANMAPIEKECVSLNGSSE